MKMKIEMLGEFVVVMSLRGRILRVVRVLGIRMRVVRMLDRRGMGPSMLRNTMLVRNYLI